MGIKTMTIANIFWRIILVIWSLSIVLPLFWIFYESLKTNQEFFRTFGHFQKN